MNNELNLLSTKLYDKIQTSFSLKETDFCSVYEMNNWNFKDLEGKPWSGASKWCDEIKGSKLT
jgi:hypothetical protein